MLDKNILLEFCTGVQIDNVNAYFDNDCVYARAAKALGKTPRAIKNTVKRAAKRAGVSGDVDGFPTMPVGEGRKLDKMTYTGKVVDGQIVVDRVWPRTSPILDSIDDAIKEMCECVAGRAPKIRVPRKSNSDLLSVYNMGDLHMGMHAWNQEVGVDFDLQIATGDIINSMSDLIGRANPSETCILINYGDAIHFHDDTNQTKGHGHSLDSDGRVFKVLGIACEVMNKCVEMALQKHKKVVVRNVKGNHDEELAMALAYQMHAWWRNEKRVTIEMSPADQWFYQFGKVMLMATHGHNMPPVKMIPFMSAKEPKMWGDTILRRALHGHFHSKSVIESLGGKVEGFSNLAPNDAWHASKGYLSELECVLIEYYVCGKEVGRQNYMLHQEEVGNSDDAGFLGKF